MKLALTLLTAGAISALSFTPANAGGFGWGGGHSSSGGWSSTSGGWSSTSGGHSSSGGTPSSSGGTPSSSGGTSSSSSGGATSVPEPSDAILLLMGAAGVVVGRKLHARKRRS